jgi:hypothetical protein
VGPFYALSSIGPWNAEDIAKLAEEELIVGSLGSPGGFPTADKILFALDVGHAA